jgi:hypothetical protein
MTITKINSTLSLSLALYEPRRYKILNLHNLFYLQLTANYEEQFKTSED